MKKLSIFLACAAAVLGFTSCDQNTDPKLNIPADKSFVLNTPAFADQYLQLEEGKNIVVTCSQPDYGYAAAAEYKVEVSLTPDFNTFETIVPVDPNSAKLEIAGETMATALCALHGFTGPEDYVDVPAEPVYLRALCSLPGVEGSECVSNVITLNKVKLYLAIKTPRNIWVIGTCNGWPTPDPGIATPEFNEKYMLTETGIETNVYTAIVHFEAGDAIFRFYTQLDGWDAHSIGSQADDSPVDISADFEGNVYSGPCMPGKGSWQFNIPEATNVNLTVDFNNNTVRFETGADYNYDAMPCMYIVGNVSGWKEPAAGNASAFIDYRIYDVEGNGVYVNKIGHPIAYTAAPQFRIYSALGGWDANSLGAQAEDSPVDVTLTGNAFTGPYVDGKGSWNFTDAPASGSFNITLDTNTKQLTVEFIAE